MLLTTYAFQRAVRHILGMGDLPILLLGGGGYHPPSAAKHFTLLTALVLGQELDADIPVEAEYWEELERDGGIHVGRDSELTVDGEKQAEIMCKALQDTLEKAWKRS